MENEEKYQFILQAATALDIVDEELYLFIEEKVEEILDIILDSGSDNMDKADYLAIALMLMRAILLGHEYALDRLE